MRKFENYCSNLEVLKRAYKEDRSNEFIISGIIDKFCIQFELAWKVLKELLMYEGAAAGKSGSPREIMKESYRVFDFIDEIVWLQMLKDRNDMSHIYNGNLAKHLVMRVLEEYIPAFETMKDGIMARYKDSELLK